MSFWDQYKALEDKVVAQYLKSSTAENKRTIADTSLNMADLFDDPSFPIEYRKQAIAEYEKLLGLSTLVQDPNNLTEVGENVFRVKRPGTGYGTDPQSVLRSQISIQFDKARKAGEQHFLGRNIPRMAWAQQLDEMLRDPASKAAAGARFMVFDTETSGLATQLAGIREVSGHMMDIDAKGATHVSELPSARFLTSRMGYGSLFKGGKLVNMAEAVGDTAFSAMTGSGDEFVEGLLPMLQQAMATDTFVGHNIGFDVNQVFVNLRQTGAYKKSSRGKEVKIGGTVMDVADIVDRAYEHMTQPGRMVDTLAMAKNRVALDTAPELAARGVKSTHSLENIVLQSNLIDLMRRDLGNDAVEDMFLGSSLQHTAKFDARLTGHLYGYLNSGEFDAGTLGSDLLGRRIRNRTVQAYAPTPVSNIAMTSHIDRDLFRQMAQDEPDRIRILDMNNGGKHAPNLLLDPDALYDYLTTHDDQTQYVMDAKITPLEQEIWRSRRDASIAFDPAAQSDPLHNLGKWRSFSGVDRPYKGSFNKLSSLFKHGHLPERDTYEAFQRELARQGNPFADLSIAERALTNALAGAATQDSTVKRAIAGDAAEEFATKYGDDLGMIRWAAQDKAHIAKSGHISLPMEFMQEAANRNLIRNMGDINADSPTMLGMSAFSYSTEDKLGDEFNKYAVNLTYGVDDSEAHQLASWMEDLQKLDIADPMRDRLREWNMTDDILGEIAAKLRDPDSAKWGIGVGFLDEAAGERGHAAMADMLQNLLRDTDKVPFRTALHSSSDGIIRTGAVVMDRLWGKDGLKDLGKRVVGMGEQVNRLTSASMSERRIAETSYAQPKFIADAAESAVKGYHAHRGKAGIGLGVTAALFGAYYINKRRTSQEQYDETINQMPTEHGIQPGMQFVAKGRRSSNYMDTANVPENLHNNRSNHALMGTNKYNNLYGGAL